MTAEASEEDGLDHAFLALADPVRRAVIARLSRGPAAVTELAEPHAMTVQAVSRSIKAMNPLTSDSVPSVPR